LQDVEGRSLGRVSFELRQQRDVFVSTRLLGGVERGRGWSVTVTLLPRATCLHI